MACLFPPFYRKSVLLNVTVSRQNIPLLKITIFVSMAFICSLHLINRGRQRSVTALFVALFPLNFSSVKLS